ncbi:MAG: hypothetical protein HOP15_12485 [Planctomycetes bacterium]|nr:hypothetical protein [Planctomycetota bacterium]
MLVVAFAGGVRTRETLGAAGNVPNLMRIAEQGVVFPRTRATNLGHFGATLSIFTGISEARGIRDNIRGTDPTLFEYLRKDLGWTSSDVWVSTSGGAQEANISHGLHPEYGPKYGANTLDGDGIFNAEFKGILDAYGRPREMGAQELALLEKMRASIGGTAKGALNDVDSVARVERFLLDELRRGTQDLKGLGAADAKAFRVARNLLAVFRPRFLAVVVREADQAHGSFNNYVQIVKRNDEMLGELWAAVQSDPELADSTALFVLPEFGRDADLNSRRGLDHGDGSDDLNYVSLVCWGPDFRRGVNVQEEVRTVDVCPTVCAMLGADARYSRGQRLPRLMA